MAAIIQNPIKS